MRRLFITVAFVTALVPATASASEFTEHFARNGDRAFGKAVWWDQDAWDVRSDTYDIAVAPNDESAKWRGHYTAVTKPGAGTMHLDYQGITSARLRNPMLIKGGKPGVVEFKAPLFATTGHWWEVAITPTKQPTPGEFTAVPARQSPEGLNNPVTGKDDDGSTNGPGHRASVEDAVNVISTGFPDAPTCNGQDWHARWALTSSRNGHVTDHVNKRRNLYKVNPAKRTKLVPWRITFTHSKVTLFGDRNSDGRLERVDAWKVSVPWSAVYVNLLYVAYQAGHHPQVGCGYGKHGIAQAQSTDWRDVRVSPVAYKRTTAFPSTTAAARKGGWMRYDLRRITSSYDKYLTYLVCSVSSGGGQICPDDAKQEITLKTMIGEGDLRGLRRAQLLADIRYPGTVRAEVNGRAVGAFPRAVRRPDVMENNGFGDSFEPEAWVRRSVSIPKGVLGAGLNTIKLTLDQTTNVELDRIQLELAQ